MYIEPEKSSRSATEEKRFKRGYAIIAIAVVIILLALLTLYLLNIRETPTVSLDNLITVNDSVNFDLNLDDPDNADATITRVDLYHGDQIVQSASDFNSLSFENLLNDTTYYIIATYTYNKHEGRGVRTQQVVSEEFTTVALNAPTISFEDIKSSDTTVSFSINFADPDNTKAQITAIKLYNNEDHSLVMALDSFDSLENLRFSSLLSGKVYYIVATYTYDLNDGNGVHTETLESNTISTTPKDIPTLGFSSLTVDENTVNFGIIFEDGYHTNAVINSIALLLDNDTLVTCLEHFDLSHVLSFTNLLNNNIYRIAIECSYDLNDGQGTRVTIVTSNSFETRALALPVVSIDNIETNNTTTVNFDITYTESDSTKLNITNVELIADEEVKQSIQEFTSYSNLQFSELNNDYSYILKVYYTYDLNDGNGVHYETVTSNVFRTIALQMPEVSLSATSTTTSITATHAITDLDGTLKCIKSVEIYETGKYDTVIATILNPENNSVTFDNLYSNTNYTIVYTYSYDLNDAAGRLEGVNTIQKTTVAKNAPIVSISSITNEETSVSVVLTHSDVDSTDLTITSVDLYNKKDNNIVKSINNPTCDELTFNDLLNNNTYYVVVNYRYNLNENSSDVEESIKSNSTTTRTLVNPVMAINSLTLTDLTASFNLSIEDVDSTQAKFNSVALFYEDGTEFASLVSFPLNTTLYFNNLLNGYTYHVAATYSYDLNDGNGEQYASIISSNTITTIQLGEPSVTIGDVTLDDTTASFSISLIDLSNTQAKVTAIDLYNNKDLLTSIKTISNPSDLANLAFTELSNNNTYKFIVTYTYDLNDGDGVHVNTLESNFFTTKAKLAPAVSFNSITTTTNSNAFSITFNDVDNTNAVITSISLYEEDGKFVKSLDSYNDLSNLAFTGLYSNKTYYMTVSYTYNLNDETGTHANTITSNNFTTTAKVVPTVGINDISSTQTSISFTISKTDIDSTLVSIPSAVLYDSNDVKISTISNPAVNQELTFDNLLSNKNYYIVVSYSYNLNNANGDVDCSVESDAIQTQEKATAIHFKNVSSSVDSISFMYDIDNLDATNTTATKVELLYNNSVAQTITSPVENTALSFNNLYSNSSYKLVISYTFNLNDGNGTQNGTVSYAISTSAREIPVVAFDTISTTTTEITYTTTVTDNGNTDATITKVELYDSTNTLIDTSEIANGKFSNLFSNTTYYMVLTYTYDLKNDTSIKSETRTSSTCSTIAKSEPNVTFETLTVNGTNVSFDVKLTDNANTNATISSIDLFNVKDRENAVNTISNPDINNTLSFSGLLNNNTYIIIANYSYNLNTNTADVNKTKASSQFSTIALVEPTITLAATATTTSINVAIAKANVDTLKDLSNISIYESNDLNTAIDSINSPASTTVLFDNLYSNTRYTIKATYTYDLNDGLGVQEKQISIASKTVAKVSPSVTVNVSTSATTLSATIATLDSDSTNLTITSIDLYNNASSVMVDSIANPDVTSTLAFEGLLNNNTYYVVVNYNYNLNENTADVVTSKKSSKVTTIALITPTAVIKDISATTTDVTFTTLVTDPSNTNATITKIELYGKSLVDTLTTFEDLSFDNLLSNTTYYMVLTYTYDLNDGNGPQVATYNTNEFKTVAKQNPTVAFKSIVANGTALDFAINTVDADSTQLTINSINAYVSGSSTIAKSLATWTDLDNLTIGGLLNDTEYVVKVAYSYDLNDGTTPKTNVVASKIVTTPALTVPQITISNIATTTTSVAFETVTLEPSSTNATITKIELYNGSIVDTLTTFENLSFKNLLSNTTYHMVLTYTYDLNNGNGVQTATYTTDEFATKAKSAPNVHFTSLYSSIEDNSNNIYFSLGIDDEDATLVSIDSMGAYIYGQSTVYKELTAWSSLSDISIDGLLNNTTYVVKVTYTYTLNDGTGVKTNTVTSEITATTVALTTPNVSISDVQVLDNNATFTVSLNKTVNTDLTITDISIYNTKDLSTVVDSMGDLTFLEDITFAGLLNNNNYKIVVTYTYTLNDINGTYTDTVESTVFTTGSKAAPAVSVTVDNATKTSVDFTTSIEDLTSTNARITSIDIIKAGDVDPCQSIKNPTESSLSFSELLSNTKYSIAYKYTYDLNDGKGVHSVTSYVNEFITIAKAAPNVSFASISASGTTIDFAIAVEDLDNTNVQFVSIEAVSADEKPEKIVQLHSWSDLSNLSIGQLLNNNHYYIRATYTYDLNDEMTYDSTIVSATVDTQVLSAPTATISLAPQNGLSVDFNIHYEDLDSTGTVLYAGLLTYNKDSDSYDIINKITDIEFNAGNADLSFSGLKNDTKYYVNFVYTYDLNDGNGVQEVVKPTTSFETLPLTQPTISINDAELNGLVLTFNLTIEDESNTFAGLDDLHLVCTTYSKNDQHLTSDYKLDGSTLTFNLLNGNTYYIDVVYRYNLNDDKGDQVKNTTSMEFTTVELSEPNVSINAEYISGTTATVTVTTDDVDSTNAKVTKIETFLQGATKGTALTFENSNNIELIPVLLNNNSYYFVATYTYDLNDGYKTRTKTIKTATIKTDTLANPEVAVNTITTTDTTAHFSVTLLDTSNTNATISAIKVYTVDNEYYGEVSNIKDLSDLTFSGLLNDNAYYIQVNYSYNLNDGTGVKTANKKSSAFTTTKKVAPIVTITSAEIDSELNLNFTVDISDDTHTNAAITDISLYYSNDTENAYKTLSNWDNYATGLTFENIYNGHTYFFVVTYAYDLNDGQGTQEGSTTSADTYTLTTATKAAPSVDFGSITTNNTTLATSMSVVDVDSTNAKINSITVFNKKGDVVTEYGKLASVADLDNLVYEGLLNNNTYYLVASYSYDLNDGIGTQTGSITSDAFTTVALVAPTASVGSVTLNETTATFSAQLNETDATNAKITAIDVYYYDGEIDKEDLYDSLQSWNNLDALTFTGLLNDNSYQIVLTYTYDLNDGEMTRKATSESTVFTTRALAIPSVSVDDITVSGSNITITYSTEDVDNTIKAINAYLYDSEDNLVQTIAKVTSTTVVFDKISSMTSYHADVVLTYNLNNVKGNNKDSSKGDLNNIKDTSATVTTGTVISDLSYTLDNENNTMVITKYKGTNKSVSLYDNYKGYSVVEIGEKAFSDTAITDITLPSSIKTLDDHAFYNCTKLTRVNYNGTLEDWLSVSIKDSVYSTPMAYAKTFALLSVDSESGEESYIPVTEIELPAGTTKVGACQFAGFNEVTSLKIPTSLTTISAYAFYNCNSLQSIEIPENVTTIGSHAFAGCSKATELELDANLTTISEYAFQNCSSIESIVIPSGVTTIGQYAFSGCKVAATITIPEGVTSIGQGAFSGCTTVSNIVIADSVKTLSNSVFANDTGLTSITFGDGLLSSQTNVLSGCTNLVSVTIPNMVSTPIANAVSGITSHITSLYFEGSIEDWLNLEFANANQNLIQYATNFYTFNEVTNEYELVNALEIPDSIEKVGSYAFYKYEGLTTVDLNKVNAIENSAFYGTGLTVIDLVDTVQSVNAEAFGNCTSLNTVIYGAGLTTISSAAFKNCPNITTAYIPNKVSQVITTSISNIPSIEDIYFEGTMLDWLTLAYSASGENAIQYAKSFYVQADAKDENGAIVYYKVTDVVIPDGTTTINPYAFYGYKALTDVHLNMIETIKTDAFAKCSGLTNVYFNGTIEDWCNINFSTLYSDPMWKATHIFMFDNEGLTEEVTEIVIPETITEIHDYTFYNFSKLTTVTLDKSVTTIGKDAFYGCNSLNRVNYTGTIEDWCKVSFSNLYSDPMFKATHFYTLNGEGEYVEVTEITIPDTITTINAYTFYNFSALTTLTMGPSVDSIGSKAFYGCKSLKTVNYTGDIEDWCNIAFTDSTSTPMSYASKFMILTDAEQNTYEEVTEIVIPNTVTAIGNYQFAGFERITNVTLNNIVTKIGDYAFQNCTSLTAFNTNNVQTIGKYAFAGDVNLSDLTITNTVTKIDDYAFSGDVNLQEVVLGRNVTTIGKEAFANCSNITTLTLNENLETIGDYAFSECINITSVVIPDSVTTIGEYAFYHCTAVEELVIGANVVDINSYAFAGCNNIESLTLGEKVENIKDYAFNGCSKINTLTLPASLKTIGEEAFSGLAITEVSIPDSVKVGVKAFYNCPNLEVIDFGTDVTTTTSFRGCAKLTTAYIPAKANSNLQSELSGTNVKTIYIKGTADDWAKLSFSSSDGWKYNVINLANEVYMQDANGDYYLATDITLGDETTTIGSRAFAGYNELTSIDLNNVTTINTYAFEGCTGLTSIDLTNVTKVADYAFVGCSNLKEITLSSKNTNISLEAFNKITSIDTIYINDSTISVEVANFIEDLAKTNTIANIYFNGTIADWLNITFEYSNYNVMQYAATFNLKNDNGEYYVFTTVEVPDDITAISAYAFYNYTALTQINLNNVTTIGEEAFIGTSITSIDLSKVTTVGDSAFANTALVDIILSANNTAINADAFYGTTTIKNAYINTMSADVTTVIAQIGTIKNIYYNGSIEDWLMIEFATYDANPMSFVENFYILDGSDYTTITTLDLTAMSVTEVSNFAFYGLKTLTTLKISENITAIGDNAFTGCENINEIYLPSNFNLVGITFIANLYEDGDVITIYYNGTINDWLNIEFINVAENPMKYASVFYLRDLNNDYAQITTLDLSNSNVTSISAYAFYNCTSIETIIIPQTVAEIGNFAFYNNTAKVYYMGTEEEWIALTATSSVEAVSGLTVYFYSEEEPQEQGNFWHYNELNAVSEYNIA